MSIAGVLTPPNGVYAARVATGAEIYPAAANIGVRPTVSATPERRLEVHLLDFAGDLYGQEIEIEFLDRIREERKFASVDQLKEQIQLDLAAARQITA
jgi:riboflavin kinase / FMN adenylyltransferase